ncbi:hypothetical protein BDN72DRAFT_831632 [Pluteus cervinus]|uniref:Uncharacterized protein n=1 Tax=Pluteus cervinus TaxID=181527 RepID=A0ACD3BED0_9AGAR|nr:hypothetical protein BDN72DRAFT_831632 [Pluteus cervinus]
MSSMWPFTSSQPQNTKDANGDKHSTGAGLVRAIAPNNTGDNQWPWPLSSPTPPPPPQFGWKDGAILTGFLLSLSIIPFFIGQRYAFKKLKQERELITRLLSRQLLLSRKEIRNDLLEEQKSLMEGIRGVLDGVEGKQRKVGERLDGVEMKQVKLKASLVQLVRENDGILEGLKRQAEKRGLDESAKSAKLQQLEEEVQDIRDRLDIGELDVIETNEKLRQVEKELKDTTREQLERETSLRQSLSSTLGDVASFMHEVELITPSLKVKNGVDVRGIERMRRFALGLQALPPPPDRGGPSLNDNQLQSSTSANSGSESELTTGTQGEMTRAQDPTLNPDPSRRTIYDMI